jgi:hypothetical protein
MLNVLCSSVNLDYIISVGSNLPHNLQSYPEQGVEQWVEQVAEQWVEQVAEQGVEQGVKQGS